MIDALLQDLQYASRSIRRSPGFAAVVCGAIALAVGANTTLFSLFNGLVLRAVPVHEPSRLAVLATANERGTAAQFLYAATVERIRAEQHVFDRLSMYSGGGTLRVQVHGSWIDSGVEAVDPEYFEMLAVRAGRGRLLTGADADGKDGAAVVVISDRLWQRQLAGDPRAVGDTIVVDRVPLTIVGVLEPGFRGLQADAGVDLFLTPPRLRAIAGDPTRPLRTINAIARLRRGVGVAEARRELLARWPALRTSPVPGLSAADQAAMLSQRLTVESVATGFSSLRRQYGVASTVLVGLTALLLAIGCANLGALMLARVTARQNQIALRRALGASLGRIVQQQLVETLTLSAIGTAAAVPLAWWASGLLQATLARGMTLPLALPMTPDARVLAATAVTAVLTGALVAVVPAWRATRTRAVAVVESPRQIVATMPVAGRVLLALQIALSLALLVAAGLFARSIARLYANDLGTHKAQVVWARLWLNPGERTTQFSAAYWQALANRLASLPGADAVAFSFAFPAYANATPPTERIEAADASAADEVDASLDGVSPGFFQTIGLTLRQGRDFASTDGADAPPVAIVTAALARRLFGDARATGRRLRFARDPNHPIEIVGVAADAPFGNLRDRTPAVLFRPMLQDPVRSRIPIVHVRGRGDVAGLRDALGPTVAAMGRHFVRQAYRLDEYADDALLRERLLVWLSSAFAAVAMLVSCLGLYGLLAYVVACRTREIAIRIALGATPRSVLRSIARDGVTIAAAGVAIGIPAALVAGRFAAALLYDVPPHDPATIAVAALVFIVVALLASVLPAQRAAAIDPMAALRRE